MKRLTLGLLFAPLFLAACYTGPGIRTFAPAQGPKGVQTTLKLQQSGQAEGELLAVRDDGLMLLANASVVFAPYTAIDDARFVERRELGWGRLSGDRGQPPEPNIQQQLRLVSRFPQGLGGDVLEQLLGHHDQRYVEALE